MPLHHEYPAMPRKHIELLVDEPIAGHFYWILTTPDVRDGHPTAIDQAPGPMPSRALAMMAGIAALQRRADERWDAPGSDTLH